MQNSTMVNMRWRWVYVIAPAPIIEKVTHPNGTPNALFRHWGMFVARKVQLGFTLPRAGDMVDIPIYGSCKVERVIQVSRALGRDLLVRIVISPRSLGDDKWWVENRNDPVVKSQEQWSFEIERVRMHFTDLEIPEDDFVDPALRVNK